MPTYEYTCAACKHEFERFESITAKPNKLCPKCNKKKAERRISAGGGFLFKGSGFYITDYKKSGATSDSKSGDSKPADSKPSTETAAKTSDSKSSGSESKSSGTSENKSSGGGDSKPSGGGGGDKKGSKGSKPKVA